MLPYRLQVIPFPTKFPNHWYAPLYTLSPTRYLHVQCLQKWYQASITGVQTQVIRTTGNGAPACKICGSAYKTAFRRADGRKASLLEVRVVCLCIDMY